MLESIEFTNYKVLRKTTLPLSPFTVILGAEWFGKPRFSKHWRG